MSQNIRDAAPELFTLLCRLEVAINTVAYCYDKVPGNFAMALTTAQADAAEARALIATLTEPRP